MSLFKTCIYPTWLVHHYLYHSLVPRVFLSVSTRFLTHCRGGSSEHAVESSAGGQNTAQWIVGRRTRTRTERRRG